MVRAVLGIWGTTFLVLTLLLACTSPLVTPTVSPGASPAATATPLPEALPVNQELMDEAWRALREEFLYTERLDPEALTNGAIQGMLEALDDPFTSYVPSQLYQLSKSDFHGAFEGIGAVVNMQQGFLAVIAPIAGSPAERAGILADDLILEVDGVTTQGMTLPEAVLKIRGPRGSKVTLSVLHLGDPEPVTVVITRDEIKQPSALLRDVKDGVARIQITQFSETTGPELKEALEDALGQKVTGIVLDLRHNPGGLLNSVVDVASEFLDGGIVLYEEDKQGNRTPWEAKKGGLALDLPVAMLVDSASASGAEVLAGALRDRGRGYIIGTQTYGKGSVNHIRELSDGSAIYITFAHWLTPNGTAINGIGLAPDLVVEITREDAQAGRDPQMDKALEYLATKR